MDKAYDLLTKTSIVQITIGNPLKIIMNGKATKIENITHHLLGNKYEVNELLSIASSNRSVVYLTVRLIGKS